MYRSMLYYLLSVWGAAVGLAFFGFLPYRPADIFFGGVYLVAICFFANQALAKIFKTTPNPESQLITGLILTLLIGPLPVLSNLGFLTLAAAAAQGSKYLLAIKKRHIFNPAAFGVIAAAILINQGASWWVGNIYLLPFVVLGGIVMTRKIHRWHLVGSFLGVYLFLALLFSDPSSIIFRSPILFFSMVMLVEPLTSPQDRNLRIYFAITVALLLALFQKFFPQIPYGLELSLLAGNLTWRLAKLDTRLSLTLIKKEQIAANIYAFWWQPVGKLNQVPGQFMEWTLPHPHPDSRGIRRFFTISSSPTESRLLLTTKFAEGGGSSYKAALKNLKLGAEIIVNNLSGDFVLPRDERRKLVFIAGGIGITPFRSIMKYLLDAGECRDIILLYSIKNENEIVFRDIFEEMEKSCTTKTKYVVTEKDGYIDEALLKKEVPDWPERLFYVSGPEPMVAAFEKMLAAMGVRRPNIKRDYFPGYAGI